MSPTFWQSGGEPAPFLAKRAFDLLAVALAMPVLLPIATAVAIAVKLTSKGPILYWSDRIGANERVFSMPKFRSMTIDAPVVATHLLRDPSIHLTPIGGILRRTSLDEIPQLWSVFVGDMSIVGPRPALFNQDDLIALRRESGVARLRPGITGLAQVNGRDDLSIDEKVRWDALYSEQQSVWFDITIVLRTFARVLRSDGVSH